MPNKKKYTNDFKDIYEIILAMNEKMKEGWSRTLAKKLIKLDNDQITDLKERKYSLLLYQMTLHYSAQRKARPSGSKLDDFLTESKLSEIKETLLN